MFDAYYNRSPNDIYTSKTFNIGLTFTPQGYVPTVVSFRYWSKQAFSKDYFGKQCNKWFRCITPEDMRTTSTNIVRMFVWFGIWLSGKSSRRRLLLRYLKYEGDVLWVITFRYSENYSTWMNDCFCNTFQMTVSFYPISNLWNKVNKLNLVSTCAIILSIVLKCASWLGHLPLAYTICQDVYLVP